MAGLRLSEIARLFVVDRPINWDAMVACVGQILLPKLKLDDLNIWDNLSSHKGLRFRAVIEAAGAGLLYPQDSGWDWTLSRTSAYGQPANFSSAPEVVLEIASEKGVYRKL